MTVEQFAYLRAPDKIRAALINAGGPRLSVDTIERKLRELPRGIIRPDAGEPCENDGAHFRVAGLIRAPKPRVDNPRNRQTPRVADAPVKRKTFRYKAPRPHYGGTVQAEQIITKVCDALDIPREAFCSESRQKYLVAARSLVVKLLRERNTTVYSYPRIAEIVGRGDHSTMINSMRKFDHYCDLFPEIADLYAELREGGE